MPGRRALSGALAGLIFAGCAPSRKWVNFPPVTLVKKIFTLLTILITVSLAGIIFIQVSWIRNMVLLRKEQIKHSVEESTKQVANELAQHKGSYASGLTRQRSLLSDEFSIDFLKPVTIGKQFSPGEIRDKFLKAFTRYHIGDIKFEFAVALLDRIGLNNNYFEIQSANFLPVFDDSTHSYTFNAGILPPSGTAGENLSPDEILIVSIPDLQGYVFRSLRWRMVASVLFTLIILSAFYLTVRTMLRQKKLSEVKNDFINNMTHEFKTPIATISLAVDALRNPKVQDDPVKMGYFSGIIREENQRMNRQVETILRASQLEKQETELHLKPLHVHAVIREVVGNFALQLQDKNGQVDLQLDAATDLIDADEVHFSNLVNNLVDNAVKYAREDIPPHIRISTQSRPRLFVMRIEDNGIGMSRDTLKRIFEKFYRAHTGNVHNVKGFGLGLSYVKTMVEAHHGQIRAESTLGKGSVFILELPLKKS